MKNINIDTRKSFEDLVDLFFCALSWIRVDINRKCYFIWMVSCSSVFISITAYTIFPMQEMGKKRDWHSINVEIGNGDTNNLHFYDGKILFSSFFPIFFNFFVVRLLFFFYGIVFYAFDYLNISFFPFNNIKLSVRQKKL